MPVVHAVLVQKLVEFVFGQVGVFLTGSFYYAWECFTRTEDAVVLFLGEMGEAFLVGGQFVRL